MASFKITNTIPQEAVGSYQITGDMTIKEATHEIKFNAQLTEEEGIITAIADLKIDRTKFNINYASESLIDAIKEKVIKNKFDLNIKLVSKN